ncbi:beta-microseminoprotein [Myotis daubentonii]|uniref:beta-microseminoprotein n=1 Tax=Myotis daubentonii TaxID=98922 RepID=UPI0028730F3E|nr:beta-microseminoprotein [Myotis daubentonii]
MYRPIGPMLITMNALLGSLAVLASCVMLCNAQCYFIPIEGSPDNLLKECKDLGGATYAMNSKWKNERCEECSCNPTGIDCCNTVAIPVGFSKMKCKKLFNQKTCTYTVVEKKNPKKTCPVQQWVM